MEIDQIVKRLEWLDNERRRDKDTIAMLQELMEGYQREFPALRDQVGAVTGELAQMKAQLDRFDQIEGHVSELEITIHRQIEESQARFSTNISSVEKEVFSDLEEIRVSVGEVKKKFAEISDLKDANETREAEDHRLVSMIQELEQRVESRERDDETYIRTVRMLEEGRRQDVKRLIDLQAESNLFRKRLDEQRGKLDLWAENLHKYDQRLAGLKNNEKERKQEQISFFERQTLKAVDQAREWKDVNTQFSNYQKKFTGFEAKMAALSVVSQSLDKSQETFDDVNERLERRIHELTEMQRLSTERLRQDMEVFFSDDQKRWANFLLQEEERQTEISKEVNNFEERLAEIEIQEAQFNDGLTNLKDGEYERLKKLSSLLKEWLE